MIQIVIVEAEVAARQAQGGPTHAPFCALACRVYRGSLNGPACDRLTKRPGELNVFCSARELGRELARNYQQRAIGIRLSDSIQEFGGSALGTGGEREVDRTVQMTTLDQGF